MLPPAGHTPATGEQLSSNTNQTPESGYITVHPSHGVLMFPPVKYVPNVVAHGDIAAPRTSSSEHHMASILCLQFDSEILVSGSSDTTCIVWDIKDNYRPIRRLRYHSAGVLDVCFDEEHIVSCSKDTTLCVWSRKTGKMLRQLQGHRGPVNAVHMRGNLVVSVSGDALVKLWNLESGKCIREFTGHTRGLACVQFSEDARTIVSGGNDQIIRVWDANTGECLRKLEGHSSLVRTLHLDSENGRVVSGSYDTSIKVFDVHTGRLLLDFPRWHGSWILSAKADYRRIVSTSQDSRTLVLDFGDNMHGIEMLESE
jgi:F-box and WD-40 domain protein 1/11